MKSRRISNRMVLFTGCLLLIMLATYSIRSAVAIGGWSGASALTGTTTAGVYPDIAVDSTGVIHVIYEETGTNLNGDRFIKYTNNKGGTFSAARNLSGPRKFSNSATLSVVTIGGVVRIQVTYEGRIDPGKLLTTHVFSIASNDGGTTWGPNIDVTPNLTSFKPTVHIDATGTVHVVYAGFEDQSFLNIFYSYNAGGGWSAPQKIASRKDGDSYNNFPTIESTYINNVVTLHMFFMGQDTGGGEVGKWVFSLRKVGAAGWTAPVVRGTGGANFPKLVAIGSTVHATWQGVVSGSDVEPYYSVSADNGVSWTAPVSRGTNTSPQGNRPDLARATDNSLMLVWDEGFQNAENPPKGDIWSNYSPNSGVSWTGAKPIYQAPSFSLESEVAGSCENYHTVWHDASSGFFRIFFSQTGPAISGSCVPTATPTPSSTPTPTTPPVDFTATRTSASPTKDANVTVQLANYQGSPNQLRYSTTPFGAGDAVPDWGPVPGTNTFSLNVSSAINSSCTATIYIQMRNSTSGAFSLVKEITASIDTAVQSDVAIYSIQQSPFRAENKVVSGQINAPDGGDPYYTRDRTFAYIIGQEPAGCSQISKHSVENLNPPAASYPYGGYAVFMDPFDENPDSNGGVLYNEQAVQPTVMVTDTLGNVKTVHSNLFYDDDPPVLTAGGTSAFPIGVASDSLAVTLVFTASVTDDGYQNAAPTNKKYWGIWIVATKTATAPTPATFQQYGQVRKLPAGATSLKNVLLVNGQTDMSVYGIRYVHIRFLDGAGNYTEEVITSPQITLNQGFKGILTYLPLLRK